MILKHTTVPRDLSSFRVLCVTILGRESLILRWTISDGIIRSNPTYKLSNYTAVNFISHTFYAQTTISYKSLLSLLLLRSSSHSLSCTPLGYQCFARSDSGSELSFPASLFLKLYLVRVWMSFLFLETEYFRHFFCVSFLIFLAD